MGVELASNSKAPKNRSLPIRFDPKVLSTVYAPILSQRPRARTLDMESRRAAFRGSIVIVHILEFYKL